MEKIVKDVKDVVRVSRVTFHEKPARCEESMVLPGMQGYTDRVESEGVPMGGIISKDGRPVAISGAESSFFDNCIRQDISRKNAFSLGKII